MTLDKSGIKFGKNTKKYNNKKNTGGDKSSLGQNYLIDYQKILNENSINSDTIFKLLEIGIFEGRSLASFSDYYRNCKIVGCDIDLTPYKSTFDELQQLGFNDNNIKIIKSNSLIKEENRFEEKYFDIIIDDGSHEHYHQTITFLNYFDNLKSNGIYIIEDTHYNFSFIFFKELASLLSNPQILNRIKKNFYVYFMIYYIFYLINIVDLLKHLDKIYSILFIRRRIIIKKK